MQDQMGPVQVFAIVLLLPWRGCAKMAKQKRGDRGSQQANRAVQTKVSGNMNGPNQ